MLRMRYCCEVAFAVVFIIVNVSGEDPGIPQEEYIQVFQEIPTLFEHIKEMLHERPEMLEKDDITTFLETASAGDDVSRLSSVENELQLVKRESSYEDLSNRAGYDWYLLKASDDFSGFVGSVGTVGSRLTADEVAERMIMIEKELEEYNNDLK